MRWDWMISSSHLEVGTLGIESNCTLGGNIDEFEFLIASCAENTRINLIEVPVK